MNYSEILNNTFLSRDPSAYHSLEKHIALESQRGKILQDTATFLQNTKEAKMRELRKIFHLFVNMQLPYKNSVPSSSVNEGYFVRLFADEGYFVRLFVGLLLPLVFSEKIFSSYLTMIFVLAKFGFDFPTSSVTSWPIPEPHNPFTFAL